MWIKRKKNNPKVVCLLMISLTLIGWVGTGFGKYDHVRLSFGGFAMQQFTIGENNEQIDVRLNISGRNWALDFDENTAAVLIQQDNETLLEGWFFPSDEFLLWENEFLNGKKFTVINYSETEPKRYFCLGSDGQYVFFTQIDGSEYVAGFFTPDNADIPQEKCSDALGRITITCSTLNS